MIMLLFVLNVSLLGVVVGVCGYDVECDCVCVCYDFV